MSYEINPRHAKDIPPRLQKSIYPEPFSHRMEGRTKRQLGNHFGIQKFGLNLTELEPKGESALFHRHSKQEEFIYILSGYPTLCLGEDEFQMEPGMCIGFRPEGQAHKLVNRTSDKVSYLEVGDRETGDIAEYPNDDLIAEMTQEGNWSFKHKNGTPY